MVPTESEIADDDCFSLNKNWINFSEEHPISILHPTIFAFVSFHPLLPLRHLNDGDGMSLD